jgi:hypothetical protein
MGFLDDIQEPEEGRELTALEQAKHDIAEVSFDENDAPDNLDEDSGWIDEAERKGDELAASGGDQPEREETLEERLERLQVDNDQLRRHEAGLRGEVTNLRSQFGAARGERDQLMEALGNIDRRLAEQSKLETSEDGWLDGEETSQETPAQKQLLQEAQAIRERLDGQEREKQTYAYANRLYQKAQADEAALPQEQQAEYLSALEYATSANERYLSAQGQRKDAIDMDTLGKLAGAVEQSVATGIPVPDIITNFARTIGWQPGQAAPVQEQKPARRTPQKSMANVGRSSPSKTQDRSLVNLHETNPNLFRQIAADPQQWRKYNEELAKEQGQ